MQPKVITLLAYLLVNLLRIADGLTLLQPLLQKLEGSPSIH